MKQLGLVLVIAPLLLLAVHYGSELAVVRQCQDAGALFDYSTMSCTFIEQSNYIPYSQRYRWGLNIALGVSLLGLVVYVAAGRKPRTRGLPFRDRDSDTRGRAITQ
ncbi:MAG: hypothetical protein ACE5K1_06805 [Acidiferrobacterales bacterium]